MKSFLLGVDEEKNLKNKMRQWGSLYKRLDLTLSRPLYFLSTKKKKWNFVSLSLKT